MIRGKDYFSLENESICLEARRVPWDSEIFGYSVGDISKLELKGNASNIDGFNTFKMWVREHDYGLISCRLPHQKLTESALLEANGFRFIEMVLHPTIRELEKIEILDHKLSVHVSDFKDLESIGDIAKRAFGYERFHVDPLLNSSLGDVRYQRWVINGYNTEKNDLLKAMFDDKIVGFFLVEYKDDLVYWHLTAIAPEWQGRGLGMRVWMAMIEHHKQRGMRQILTTISARNMPALNLYSKLNFRFMPPEMTFHWVNTHCK